MRFHLVPHADHPPSESVRELVVDLARLPKGGVALTYAVDDLGGVKLPPMREPERTDGLWQTTCFELFLRRPHGYWELNFSPSGQWAAYAFDGYRDGMTSLDLPETPVISRVQEGIQVALRLPPEPEDTAWEVGLSAVLEEAKGPKSFWALAHPPGSPDFHHRACFAAKVPPIAAP